MHIGSIHELRHKHGVKYREGEGDRYWGKLEVKRSGLLYGNYGESQGKDLVFVVVGKKQMKGMESMKMNRGRV